MRSSVLATAARSIADAPDEAVARDLVDDLIADRARGLARSRCAPLCRRVIDLMVGRADLVALVDQCRGCRSGAELADLLLRVIAPRVSSINLHHMPGSGGCIMIANHPTGLVDGVALYDQICPIRRDVTMLVFHDVTKINPRVTDTFVPVEWRVSHRTAVKAMYTMACTTRALAAGRVVAIFPSGRLAYWNGLRLRDRPWRSTFLQLALHYRLPIVPAHIAARNSLAFYALSQISTELRDIQSIREFQNKRGAPYRITFGRPILPAEIEGDPEAIAVRLQRFVENVLPRHPDAGWRDA